MWMAILLVLCLPLLFLPFAPPSELGGPSQSLGSWQAMANVYEVQPGDTLSSIASRYGVPVSWLMASNNLVSTTIYPGQKIFVVRDGVLHTVKEGETLASIAAAYGVSAEKIAATNGLTLKDGLKPGQRLYIPNPAVVPEVEKLRESKFIWPVRGTLTSPFGPRIHPIYGIPSFHTGIDIAVPEGTKVLAADEGTVTFAGWQDGFGLLVVIDHGNGYETYYGHLSKILVVPGQKVSRGEVVALSGNTGLSTGPHLHFEVRLFGSPVDPQPLLP